MKPNLEEEQVKRIFLKDYKVLPYLISKVELTFELDESQTRVRSKLQVRRKEEAERGTPLSLHGENLELVSISMNGKPLSPNEYKADEKTLSFSPQEDSFELEIETLINPSENKALEGLYRSGDIFCTQNESEGFRKITYFYDRPDCLATYTTKIIADKKQYPVLLSNGNLKDSGDLESGRHYVAWEDPFPKPCYLFALVAGDLACVKDTFKTMSGRDLDLRIYVEKGNEDRCDHAMASLKNALKWDEDKFGRECDLDTYMIVAVDAFNFGAMENKGLNIFNSQYVLANPKTATDQNYDAIEGVIGHEYFHNWSGNRVTCRDWFQITLKEGLTVFRDQEFSADMTSRPVKRIEDARIIQEYQFAEAAGPNKHAIRPRSYIEVNNFYTSTVYQKGAEVIRMIWTLLGEDRFRKGMDSYFETYDGQAVTTEEFVSAMEKTSGVDLTQFRRWYDQVGTPACKIKDAYDAKAKTYKLSIAQVTTPDQTTNEPMILHIPIAIGLLNEKGKDIILDKDQTTTILNITEQSQDFEFPNIESKPTPSILRNFSAPINIDYEYTPEQLSFLFLNDSDPYNRYKAGQKWMEKIIKKNTGDHSDKDWPPEIYVALEKIMTDQTLDGHFRSFALAAPNISVLIADQNPCDVAGCYQARNSFLISAAKKLQSPLQETYHHCLNRLTTSDDRQTSSAVRALKNTCLSLLQRTEEEQAYQLAQNQFEQAQNMTDEIAALAALSLNDSQCFNESSQSFRSKWKSNSLVINKWFVIHALRPCPGTLEKLQEIEKDPLFDRENPNKIRSLYHAFAQNLHHFHAESGEGYQWIADKIIEIDKFNPKAAASLSTNFKLYARLPKANAAQVREVLERILAEPKLSSDSYEIISNTLKSREKIS